MNDLDRLLNEPKSQKLADAVIPKLKEKPTAAATKAAILVAQKEAIAAASVGGRVFKSAKDLLADSVEVTGYTEEFVSPPVASKK